MDKLKQMIKEYRWFHKKHKQYPGVTVRKDEPDKYTFVMFDDDGVIGAISEMTRSNAEWLRDRLNTYLA